MQTSSSTRIPPKPVLWAARLILIGGIILITIQYFSARSVWGDEAMLILNITDLDLEELLGNDLDFNQSAPQGFLLAQRLMALLFGANDFSLRIIPLLSTFGTIGIFYTICLFFTERKKALLLSGALACLPVMVYYSSEVKQYAFEMCLFNAFILLLLKFQKGNRAAPVLVYSLLSVWGAFSCIFLYPFVSLALIYRRKQRALMPVLLLLANAYLFYVININVNSGSPAAGQH